MFAGLLLLVGASVYAAFAGTVFSQRGQDVRALDRPLALAALRMTPVPMHLASVRPENNRELYLVTVITDQHDVMFGMTLLVLRMIVALVAGGLGLVFLTAGSTEWEIRSERPSS